MLPRSLHFSFFFFLFSFLFKSGLMYPKAGLELTIYRMMALNFCPPPALQSWDYRHACPYPDHVMLGLEARASCTPRKHSTNSLIPSPQFPISLASGDVQYFLANITSYLKAVFFSLKYFIYYPCVCTKKEIAAGLPLCSGTKIPEVFCKPLPCPQT